MIQHIASAAATAAATAPPIAAAPRPHGEADDGCPIPELTAPSSVVVATTFVDSAVPSAPPAPPAPATPGSPARPVPFPTGDDGGGDSDFGAGGSGGGRGAVVAARGSGATGGAAGAAAGAASAGPGGLGGGGLVAFAVALGCFRSTAVASDVADNAAVSVTNWDPTAMDSKLEVSKPSAPPSSAASHAADVAFVLTLAQGALRAAAVARGFARVVARASCPDSSSPADIVNATVSNWKVPNPASSWAVVGNAAAAAGAPPPGGGGDGACREMIAAAPRIWLPMTATGRMRACQ